MSLKNCSYGLKAKRPRTWLKYIALGLILQTSNNPSWHGILFKDLGLPSPFHKHAWIHSALLGSIRHQIYPFKTHLNLKSSKGVLQTWIDASFQIFRAQVGLELLRVYVDFPTLSRTFVNISENSLTSILSWKIIRLQFVFDFVPTCRWQHTFAVLHWQRNYSCHFLYDLSTRFLIVFASSVFKIEK